MFYLQFGVTLIKALTRSSLTISVLLIFSKDICPVVSHCWWSNYINCNVIAEHSEVVFIRNALVGFLWNWIYLFSSAKIHIKPIVYYLGNVLFMTCIDMFPCARRWAVLRWLQQHGMWRTPCS